LVGFVEKKFEVFFYSHFMFIAFFAFGSLHNHEFILYMILAVIIFVFDRLTRFMWGIVPMKTLLLRVKQTAESRGIVQVRFPKNRLASWLKLYHVGQYVFVNFPQCSFLEWHPFSISSGPDERTLEIHIRGLGDHTKKLLERAKTSTDMWIRVDGPYGNHNLNYRRFPTLALVGGGIGITPIVSILKDIYRTGDVDPKVQPRPHLIEQIYCVWIVQDVPQSDWFKTELDEFLALSGKSGFPLFNLSVYVTRAEASEKLGWRYIAGRPSFDFTFENIATSHADQAATVFACGPEAMVNECWDCANAQTRKGLRFEFHHETFEF